MDEVLERLSAVEELQLEAAAKAGFGYLLLLCPEGSADDREGVWAVANNAALVYLSLKENGRRRFGSVYEVLESLCLDAIARLAQEYEERFGD